MNIEKIFNEFPILIADEISLLKIEEDHLDDVFAIYNNEQVFEFCGIIPKHNKATVKKMISHFERDFNNKKRIKWGIVTRSEYKLVGIVEAFDFNQKINMVTIGYYLAEDYWGKGIASAAVSKVVEFLFNEVDVNRIQADVMPLNDASKKVLLKNGFLKEGLLREATIWSGKGIIDIEIYSILKRNYHKESIGKSI
ncbi:MULTISPECIES: GNAT family N-acetyltransferase [Heyndrickxia]|jgi:ribosomal-protein-alanine N-acetyltransferase|uniref:GNAT family N-acetyltransferase n=1 Tax=Heyndrickxia oleronia TaxID=38875 RepID=A0AAW6SUF5_9BACI|nr:GNAT family N-acetyltransferase [Heyndrickxia oleronia]MCI1613425.1 GNAT family N-acetyltransferase [Heyndrickxia oleronia]MCI1744667.1 GNAT family N-acetyltransferase [Heyndrickxia oleronia]MCI1761374.1 GNAT family N-acetyltransferase [Heyndrickxia oleronia]MDH5160913.1 GNAT family N-acetyltransferase [Heyndrickxia oleronia]